MDYDSYVATARARAAEARRYYEQLRKELGEGKQPSASPTSFSDCASLHEQSGAAYRLAAYYGHAADFVMADVYSAQGEKLATAADSCDESAGGHVIRL